MIADTILQKSELAVAFSLINSQPRHQVAFPYHIIRERLVDSGALWNYKLCSDSSSARASSPPMSSTGITNCTSRHSVLCVQKGRAEALKDTVDLGRNGRSRLEQRSARVNQIRVSPRVSCDRHGKLDVEDCSSECLYLYWSYARGWYVNTNWGSGKTVDFSKIARGVENRRGRNSTIDNDVLYFREIFVKIVPDSRFSSAIIAWCWRGRKHRETTVEKK